MHHSAASGWPTNLKPDSEPEPAATTEGWTRSGSKINEGGVEGSKTPKTRDNHADYYILMLDMMGRLGSSIY